MWSEGIVYTLLQAALCGLLFVIAGFVALVLFGMARTELTWKRGSGLMSIFFTLLGCFPAIGAFAAGVRFLVVLGIIDPI